ncbi:MAG: bifunctional diaminohydroxyphosphoribosylaminopyrimidine deaminase/5-amino-6-(5-phosphoribosylamino)uracil reductase RibD [Actinomycetota bacterium]|nr:bifunctional diaminohydroxyphosphoribosylaminopyrimidine deaminase/5-amino-6-(5-phosphoribosylamino)uracil reductase RibD [Actinomycetota bacterium]
MTDESEAAADGCLPAGRAPMRRALELAGSARLRSSPNPWVGCVIVPVDSRKGSASEVFEGATEAPGARHAEQVALDAAGARARGATLYTTLEPCAHHGRTEPCVDAIVRAGVARVVVGMVDPDVKVSGRGIEALARAGIDVEVGVMANEVAEQLAPYVKHRTSGRPFVVLKLALSLDGRIAARDRSSRWITGDAARADVHRLRAVSDAVLVGAGTIRADDPELSARTDPPPERQPLRVVLGCAPDEARAQPLVELSGDLGSVLDDLGRRGVLQVLVEGGATVAHGFHSAGLVDRYVLYVAPVFFGGDDGVPAFAGPGAGSMDALWRGRFVSVTELGGDLRIEVA